MIYTTPKPALLCPTRQPAASPERLRPSSGQEGVLQERAGGANPSRGFTGWGQRSPPPNDGWDSGAAPPQLPAGWESWEPDPASSLGGRTPRMPRSPAPLPSPASCRGHLSRSAPRLPRAEGGRAPRRVAARSSAPLRALAVGGPPPPPPMSPLPPRRGGPCRGRAVGLEAVPRRGKAPQRGFALLAVRSRAVLCRRHPAPPPPGFIYLFPHPGC